MIRRPPARGVSVREKKDFANAAEAAEEEEGDAAASGVPICGRGDDISFRSILGKQGLTPSPIP